MSGSTFTCGICDYTTEELKEGIAHAASTDHELTFAVDNEGTTMTISVVKEDRSWFTAEVEVK